MSTSAPDSGNSNTLAVMQSLTAAIQGLSSHVQTLSAGGQAAAGGSPSAPSLYVPSSPSMASAPVGVQANAAAAQAALAQQQAQQQALAEDAASESGSSASTPPNATPTTPTSAQTENAQAMQALTWESMGNLGGPLGRVKMAQYTVGQYQNVASGAATSLANSSPFSSPVLDENGNPTGETTPNSTLSGIAGGIAGFGTGKAAVGLTAFQSAFSASSNWAATGQDLGYGNRIGLYGAGTSSQDRSSYKQASEQGASLSLEAQALRGTPGGMTHEQGQSIVSALANAGFSNQNGGYTSDSGDNTSIAQGVVAPLVQQGVSASGAAEWADALRNSGTNISSLTTSLQGMRTAAQATKETTDQFNSSLLEFASSQVANGGTAGQAAQTGMDFTAATGIAPSALGTLQNNPVYQGLMMGENGVLPSDIGNLTPGAQLEGVRSMLNMYGSGLSGLDQNKYTTVGGVKMISSYGNSAEAAQVATMTGLPQNQVMRLMNETSGAHFNNVVNAMKVIGSPDAGEDGQGSMLYSILDKSRAKGEAWSGLSAHDKEQATHVWDTGIGKSINNMGLHESQIRAIDSTSNIRSRADKLRKDLDINQGKSKANQITGKVDVKIGLTGGAQRWLKVVSSKGQVMAAARAGGDSANTTFNSPLGDNISANDLSKLNFSDLGDLSSLSSKLP